MQAQGQAPRSQARVKVGPFHLDSLGGWSPTQDAVVGLLRPTSGGPLTSGTSTGRRGPACSALKLHLPSAPEDPLAQLLQVLQDLREAHSCSPASSPASDNNCLLELQT